MEILNIEIIFRDDTREFKATVNNIEEIYDAVRDGMVCMTFNKKTADIVVNDLREED